MSETHTPGPWVFDPSNNGNENGYGNGVHAETSGWTLAHIPHRNPDWEANARLIAAAPDLLACLKEAVRDFSIMRMGSRMDKWDAAISKAEGR